MATYTFNSPYFGNIYNNRVYFRTHLIPSPITDAFWTIIFSLKETTSPAIDILCQMFPLSRPNSNSVKLIKCTQTLIAESIAKRERFYILGEFLIAQQQTFCTLLFKHNITGFKLHIMFSLR